MDKLKISTNYRRINQKLTYAVSICQNTLLYTHDNIML